MSGGKTHFDYVPPFRPVPALELATKPIRPLRRPRETVTIRDPGGAALATVDSWIYEVYTRRQSGLVQIFDVPQLTISAAIDRGWERGRGLYRPRPPEYLPTYPLPGAFSVPGSWAGTPPDLEYWRPGGSFWSDPEEVWADRAAAALTFGGVSALLDYLDSDQPGDPAPAASIDQARPERRAGSGTTG